MSRSTSLFFLLALLLLTSSADLAAQTTGFLGIKWGASYKQVVSGMSRVRGAVAAEGSDESTLLYAGGSYLGVKAPSYELSLEDGRFNSVYIVFRFVDEESARSAYKTITRKLSSQYGRIQPQTMVDIGMGAPGSTPSTILEEHEIRGPKTTIATSLLKDGGSESHEITIQFTGTLPPLSKPAVRRR